MKSLLLVVIVTTLSMGWALAVIAQGKPPKIDMEELAKEIENSPAFARAKEVADNIEAELNRRVEEMVREKGAKYRAIEQKIVDDVLGKAPVEEKKPDLLFDENARIFIFVSRSVPLEVLKSYAAAIDALESENISFVFRAFPRHFLDTFLRKDPDCTDEGCVTKAKIKIGSRLFSQYGINKVPAVVYDPDPGNTQDDWLRVSGATPLNKVLALFYRELGKESFKVAANRVVQHQKR